MGEKLSKWQKRQREQAEQNKKVEAAAQSAASPWSVPTSLTNTTVTIQTEAVEKKRSAFASPIWFTGMNEQKTWTGDTLLRSYGVGGLITSDVEDDDEDDFDGLKQAFGTRDAWLPKGDIRPVSREEMWAYFSLYRQGWDAFKNMEQGAEYVSPAEIETEGWFSPNIHKGTRMLFTPAGGSFHNPLPPETLLRKLPKSPIPDFAQLQHDTLETPDFRRIPGVRCTTLPLMQEVLVHPSALQKVEYDQGIWDRLVVPSAHRERLMTLIGRETEYKHQIYEGWGMEHLHKGAGLKILLQGPPGTGKTMTAEAISARLRRPLLRVGASYARNENWIETMFDFASTWGLIVLFDEAEAFISHRRSGELEHNAVISIMLRHMESFQGVMVLTTNKLPDISNAAKNRIHATFTFGMPTPADRRMIAKGNLPEEMPIHRREEVLDFLAELPITGRQIGYVVLEAASWAASDGASSVNLSYFQRAAAHLLEDSKILVDKDRE